MTTETDTDRHAGTETDKMLIPVLQRETFGVESATQLCHTAIQISLRRCLRKIQLRFFFFFFFFFFLMCSFQHRTT